MFNESRLSKRAAYFCWALIGAILLTRLISLEMLPLFDKTEARYGEIARIMFETKNWVTPYFDYNVPFWGKPPLHTWITAISFEWFGISEFTARLPHFICGLMTLLILYRFTFQYHGQKTAMISTLILCSSVGFIAAIGMVMTESALILSTTLAMSSFWNHYQQNSRHSGLLFFGALALGMLIKGPVAVVLVVIALMMWSLTTGVFIRAVKSLPWVSGLAVFFVICLPWYVWAEIRSPGFINYFIVGEHIQRFLEPGWTGDLYGNGHDQYRGKIWLFWIAAAFPWSFVILISFAQWVNKKCSTQKHDIHNTHKGPVSSYLISWMIAPMILFTFSGNILMSYVLPGFSAMAILTAKEISLNSKFKVLATLPLAFVVMGLIVYALKLVPIKSQAELLGKDRSFPQEAQLFYWHKRPFSARFYSKGQAQLLSDEDHLDRVIDSRQPFYLAITLTDYDRHQNQLLPNCIEHNRSNDKLLLACF